MSTYTSSQVCTTLNTIIDLGLDKKYYQPKELNKKLKKFQSEISIQHFEAHKKRQKPGKINGLVPLYFSSTKMGFENIIFPKFHGLQVSSGKC